jgi:hypothetical protein
MVSSKVAMAAKDGKGQERKRGSAQIKSDVTCDGGACVTFHVLVTERDSKFGTKRA